MEAVQAEPSIDQHGGVATLSLAQWLSCMGIIRLLMKRRDARHFLEPVDIEAWGIPHYPHIVPRPMDFSIVKLKLTHSDPSKLGTSLYPRNDRYLTVAQFEDDVRLIFSNCITFNGAGHSISRQAKRLEVIFDRELMLMPASLHVKPTYVPPKGTRWWLEDTEEATTKKVSALEAKLNELDPQWSSIETGTQAVQDESGNDVA